MTGVLRKSVHSYKGIALLCGAMLLCARAADVLPQCDGVFGFAVTADESEAIDQSVAEKVSEACNTPER